MLVGPRLDADPARTGRIRARHRHGDRRQRARLRESQGGVRRLPLGRAADAPSPVGFNKAWSAIIDSNVTTLLAAGLLFFLGSGPIKGFGVTLSIGVIASMISALIIARVLCELAVSNKPVASRPAISGLSHHRQGPHLAGPQGPRQLMRRRKTVARPSPARPSSSRSPASSPRASTSASSSPAAASSTTRSARTSRSTRRARPSPTPASPRPSCRTADTADFTVRTGEISNDEEQRIEDELAAVGGDGRQDRRPDDRRLARRPAAQQRAHRLRRRVPRRSCSTSPSASSGPSASPRCWRWRTT